jgi:hypothetical protein
MSLISAVRTYLATYSGLESGALLLVDQIGQTPIQYAIVPMPGERITARYLNGASEREFPFVFETVRSTADDLERIETSGFLEGLMDWFESQTDAGNLPSLATKKTATSIEAVQWGSLFEQGESSTGIYQIICRLTYTQQP